LEPEQRGRFRQLDYFEPAPALRFTVKPELLPRGETYRMPLTSGDEEEYVRWAKVRFQVEGRAAELTVFLDTQSGEPFLPFKDGTAQSDETDSFLRGERLHSSRGAHGSRMH
jgi:uncharacterized protein